MLSHVHKPISTVVDISHVNKNHEVDLNSDTVSGDLVNSNRCDNKYVRWKKEMCNEYKNNLDINMITATIAEIDSIVDDNTVDINILNDKINSILKSPTEHCKM